jgi:hypothetical protein
MEPECPLPHSRAPATCPYPEPDQSKSMPPHPTIQTTCFNIQKVCILSTQRTVELGSVMKETEYFVSYWVLF